MLLKRTRSPDVCLVVAILAAFHSVQTEASPLKESADQPGQREDPEGTLSVYKPGIIEFGEGAERDLDYQADSPTHSGWHNKFWGLHPFAQCGPLGLKFSAYGWGSKYFKHPYLKPSCGYKKYKTPHWIVLQVPFDGCNVMIQDGYHKLPLIWNNMPVTVKCPAADDTTTIAPTPFPFPFLPFGFPPQEPTTVPPTHFPFPWVPWPLKPQEPTTNPTPFPFPWFLGNFPPQEPTTNPTPFPFPWFLGNFPPQEPTTNPTPFPWLQGNLPPQQPNPQIFLPPFWPKLPSNPVGPWQQQEDLPGDKSPFWR